MWPGAPGTGSMQGCWAANVSGQPRKGGKEKGGGGASGSLAWKGKQPSLGWERGLRLQTGDPVHSTLPHLCYPRDCWRGCDLIVEGGLGSYVGWGMGVASDVLMRGKGTKSWRCLKKG